MKPLCTIVPLIVALAGCGSSGDSGNSNPGDNVTSYPYEVVECGDSHHTTITEPSRELITDVYRFREVFGVTDLNNQGEVPDVDFDTRQVIAIHAGAKANPGHGLRVDNVVKDGESLQVRYTAIEPDSSGDCAYPSVVVYPYCFISVEQSDLPITYNRETEEGSCE